MKRFVKKILVFATLFLIVDKLFIPIRNYVPRLEVDKRLEMILQGRMNKDILIFGSSRGARDIIASQIEDSLGLRCFNLSYPGASIGFQTFLLEKVLQHNQKPSTIFLVLDEPNELIPNPYTTFRLDRLYPLVRYPEIRDELIARGEKNKWLSRIFVLHQLNRSNFRLRKKKFSPLDTLLDCGSMPISFQKEHLNMIYDIDRDTVPYPLEKESKSRLESFTRFLQSCSEHNIELHLVFPPNFGVLNPAFVERMEILSAAFGVNYIFYDQNDGRYKNRLYFHDESHLNTRGASIFTDELIQFLK